MGIAAPTTEEIMVDVLESNNDTGGGSLNMHENSQRTNWMKNDHVPKIQPQFEPPQRVWLQMDHFLSLITEGGNLERVYIRQLGTVERVVYIRRMVNSTDTLDDEAVDHGLRLGIQTHRVSLDSRDHE